MACLRQDTCAGPIGFHSFIAAVEFFPLWVPYLAHRNTACLSVNRLIGDAMGSRSFHLACVFSGVNLRIWATVALSFLFDN